jgi:hypothetical protein
MVDASYVTERRQCHPAEGHRSVGQRITNAKFSDAKNLDYYNIPEAAAPPVSGQRPGAPARGRVQACSGL